MEMRLHRSGMMAAVVLAGSWAVPAIAQQEETREAKFRSWDRNRDGMLSESEFTGQPGNFRAMDCNHDGVLTMDEFVHRYECGGKAPASARADDRGVRLSDEFARIDRNDDGLVTRREWPRATREFRAFDRNSDGVVTRREWTDQFGTQRAEDSRVARFEDLDRNHDGVLSRFELSGEPIRFFEADRNRDQVVSLDEYLSAAAGSRWVWPDERRFRELDRNGDDRLSRAELRNDVAFDMLDRNGDGWISRWEVRDRGALAERFHEMDHDHNGYISRWEWHADRWFFDRLDVDRDGRLTSDEFLSFPDGRYALR
jgi:Ca2+-binding EF-hand superfamily protein